MAISRFKVKEQIIEWAFNITDINEERKQKIIDKNIWLQKDSDVYLEPTIKQLEKFSTNLHVPFANLLLDTPPELENIKLAFRTAENVPANVSLTVRDIIYEMKRKQAWFKEESGLAVNKLSFINKAENYNEEKTLNLVKELLNLNHFNDSRELFNDLRNQLSKLGVLNMQKGGAGNANNRPLDLKKDLRAFVLLDEYAPLIFINQKDTYTGRIFSLIHEFIHLLHGSDELFLGENDIQEERHINKVVSNFLMPENKFKELYKIKDIKKLASYFNTSPQATFIRAKELQLIDKNEQYDKSIYEVEKSKSKRKGGDVYKTALSLNDNRFMSALVSAQEKGSVPPTRAASLIGISYNMLDNTVKQFDEREVIL